MNQHPAGHVIGILTLFGYIGGLLPPIAALLAIVWYILQIISWVSAWRRSRRTPSETQD